MPASFRLIEDGTLDGLRIDHIDGLLDPKRYFDDLRAASPRPFYLVVEKILAAHEQLREDWPIEGTTGYDFTNLVLGALIDPAAEASFTDIYRRFTGHHRAVRADRPRMQDPHHGQRDGERAQRARPRCSTRRAPEPADRRLHPQHPAAGAQGDRRLLPGLSHLYRHGRCARRMPTGAISTGRWRRRGAAILTIDRSRLRLPARVLSGELVAKPTSGFSRTAVLRFAMKLQQYSGPVMAKGLEDTAFYRYNRFVALNEVGGDPDHFGICRRPVPQGQCKPRQALAATPCSALRRTTPSAARTPAPGWPCCPSCPRSGRGRSTPGAACCAPVAATSRATAPPDRNDEYLLYQLLVGSWPVELLGARPTSAALEIYGKRLAGALEKSMREAKLHSTWTSPNTVYEEAMQALARDALDSAGSGFLASFLPFAQKIARLGVQNSLIQTVMKLTLPGVPDIYQGCEMWDLSLVDPDNRRPVDYEIRAAALTELRRQAGQPGRPQEAVEPGCWRVGRTRRSSSPSPRCCWICAACRRICSTPVAMRRCQSRGQKSERALGYFRSGGGERVAVLVARFPGLRDLDPDWSGTTASLPEGRWTDWLTGRRYEGGAIDLASLFEILPAVVLRQSETF